MIDTTRIWKKVAELWNILDDEMKFYSAKRRDKFQCCVHHNGSHHHIHIQHLNGHVEIEGCMKSLLINGKIIEIPR